MQKDLSKRLVAVCAYGAEYAKIPKNKTTSVLLFVDRRFINDSDEFGKMFESPFLFSSEKLDAVVNILSLLVFCACNDFCTVLSPYSFKYFHAVDVLLH